MSLQYMKVQKKSVAVTVNVVCVALILKASSIE